MLINVNPLLSPEILLTLRSMGHGDRIVLSDANFPSYSHAQKIHRMDGLNIPQAAEALLSVFPLDSFITEPVQRMEIDGKPQEINEVQKDLIDTVHKVSGPNWKVGSIERQQFYIEAKETFAVITTSDTRPYGCFIFTKGVLKPDGSVWII
ncbi:MAG: L-fucose mutarotase [Alphaproteobacteria bacterium MarineAlpha5_Bin8]|nr:MAG: L-fucose mutarotase [Alphaproteobacteria bacterium MarineAlpha5_Bin7]PPR46265.1 MAG: L-fucose mutarotase [Alphaproteobacteria bacterium MarineAlpha5_Bin8]PPR53720.1 MAG: L-fucose mutarotase [Alphaproteobacteria bacterium MarineAlpha5_Bin6]|tara:strand:- start:12010 stop:12462 length:453 start_codon:yes stop_codon:yes gene_type:complete